MGESWRSLVSPPRPDKGQGPEDSLCLAEDQRSAGECDESQDPHLRVLEDRRDCLEGEAIVNLQMMGFSIDDHVVAVHVVVSQPGGRVRPLFRGQETSVVRRLGDEKESRKATSDCDHTYEATEEASSALRPSGLLRDQEVGIDCWHYLR